MRVVFGFLAPSCKHCLGSLFLFSGFCFNLVLLYVFFSRGWAFSNGTDFLVNPTIWKVGSKIVFGMIFFFFVFFVCFSQNKAHEVLNGLCWVIYHINALSFWVSQNHCIFPSVEFFFTWVLIVAWICPLWCPEYRNLEKKNFDAHSSNKTDRMHKRVEWSDLVYQVERLEGRVVGKILPLLVGREKLLRKREGL